MSYAANVFGTVCWAKSKITAETMAHLVSVQQHGLLGIGP